MQTDLSALAGLRWPLVEVSAEATKSLYDRDLGAGVRESQFLELAGFDAALQGFPDTSVGVRLKWRGSGRLKPFASYTHTTFKLSAAASHGFEAGARAKLGRTTLKAAYQRYLQNGYAGRDYFTLGAGLYF